MINPDFDPLQILEDMSSQLVSHAEFINRVARVLEDLYVRVEQLEQQIKEDNHDEV